MSISRQHHAASLAQAVERGDLDHSAHSVQFYTDDEFLLEELSRFIGSTLGGGGASVIIATKAHRDGLAQRLKAGGLNVDLAVARGRFVVLDAAETLSQFMRNGTPDRDLFLDVVGGVVADVAAAAGGEHPRVAAFGEMVALLWAEGNAEAAIQLEQLWNGLAQTYTFNLRCAYPMSFFSRADDGGPLETICREHSHVIPAESFTAIIDEEERLRAITLLQQKAAALESEVAERKRVEQALRDSNAELRKAVAVRDDFLAIAAHELKTPITSLRAFAQLLLRDARRAEARPLERLELALSTIDRQSGKLSHLVDRLLDSSQIEEGRLRVEPARTNLAALVRGALAQQYGAARHTFVFAGPEHLDALVDPLRFEQVVTNLLDNAVKFCPGGGSVMVDLARSEDGGIRLTVTDQGVGIPREQREDVFDRFQQAHGEQHLSGIGLGLYITREIVELHGGSIWIEEPEHPGSRFVVSLPAPATTIQAIDEGGRR